MSDLWDKFAYFSQRTPILVNTSIGTQSAMNSSDLESTVAVKPAGRAASLTYGYLTFWEGVKNNTVSFVAVATPFDCVCFEVCEDRSQMGLMT